MPQNRLFIVVAALALALATALGAWAAHGLESLIAPPAVATFRTGVEYHFYHALGLLLLSLLIQSSPHKRLYRAAAWLLIAGIICFSGSLYFVALGYGGYLIHVAPIGGLALIAAWITVAIGALQDS